MKNISKFVKFLIYTIIGAVVGFINGIFGGGGGMIVVPVLQHIVKLPVKKSHASAIFIILPLSIVSIITYNIRGSLNLNGGLVIIISVVIGGIIGSLLLKILKNKIIGVLFALLMIAAGVKMVI